jgi:hypothetical protein
MASKVAWTSPAWVAASARVCARVRPNSLPAVASWTASCAVWTAEAAAFADEAALDAYTPSDRTGPVHPTATSSAASPSATPGRPGRGRSAAWVMTWRLGRGGRAWLMQPMGRGW